MADTFDAISTTPDGTTSVVSSAADLNAGLVANYPPGTQPDASFYQNVYAQDTAVMRERYPGDFADHDLWNKVSDVATVVTGTMLALGTSAAVVGAVGAGGAAGGSATAVTGASGAGSSAAGGTIGAGAVAAGGSGGSTIGGVLAGAGTVAKAIALGGTVVGLGKSLGIIPASQSPTVSAGNNRPIPISQSPLRLKASMGGPPNVGPTPPSIPAQSDSSKNLTIIAGLGLLGLGAFFFLR